MSTALQLPCKIQKASVAKDGALLLELFLRPQGSDASNRAWLWVRHGLWSLHVEKPGFEAAEPVRVSQSVLRKECIPAGLVRVDSDERTHRFRLERHVEPTRTIVVERDARAPRWLLLDEDDKVLVMEGPRCSEGRDLRRKAAYAPPRSLPVLAEAVAAQTSARADPLVVRARAERKRLKRLEDALQGDLRKHGDPATTARQGEWLKSVLHLVKRGMNEVVAWDDQGLEVRISLQPTLDATGNLQRLFQRAKKAAHAHALLAPRLASITAAMANIDELLAQPSLSEEHRAQLEDQLAKPTEAPSARRQAMRAAGTRQPWRTFIVRGARIRVGRSAKDNDALVKACRGADGWFHARHLSGSHVVVPAAALQQTPDIVHDAALLAAWFSPLRKSTRGDVQHTLIKHLRKPPGAPAGLVFVQEEQVLAVRIDEDVIAALLRSEVSSMTNG
jgi:hypothetical protein